VKINKKNHENKTTLVSNTYNLLKTKCIKFLFIDIVIKQISYKLQKIRQRIWNIKEEIFSAFYLFKLNKLLTP
jgi:hypothetical protein